jgi:diguanylate cyclase (GGDEF)-like protein
MEYRATHRRAPSSLYEEQLRMGFGSLRFSDYLETEFREVYNDDNLQKTRLVLGLCAIVVAVVTLVSVTSLTPDSDLLGRFGLTLMLPILVATLGASYFRQRFVYQTLLALSALTVGVAGAIIDLEASMAGQGYYFAGQVGWVFIMWSMLGLLFSTAAGLCALVSLVYLGGAVYVGLPAEQLFFEAFMLLNVNLLGGYSCYTIEYASRRTFLESRILNQLAERDGLTGLYNRRAFDQQFERIWRQSRRDGSPLTVMLIDIDHFKAYNDLYGHQAGDDALKQVARVIAGSVQRPLDMAARYGGEEFALVLYGPATDYVTDLPDLLRQDVLQLGITHDGAPESARLTISVGVAVVNPDNGRSIAGAIQMADEALYQAKEEGRNRVVIKLSGSTLIETGRFRARQAV